MMILLDMTALAIIGAIEAVIYESRYRASAKADPLAAGLSTFAVCVSRVLFVFVGASVVVRNIHDGGGVLAAVAAGLGYAITASLVTYKHALAMNRRGARSRSVTR